MELDYYIKGCLLCHAESDYQAVFVPDAEYAEKFGALKLKPGEGRMVRYALCERCYSMPDAVRSALVEAYIEEHVVARKN